MEYCDINDSIRLIVDYKESFITTIGCLLPAGSMFEKFKERGSALFLEHVLFQQTTQRSGQQIEKKLQEIGGTLIANAMRDIFVFYGTAPSCNASKLAELLVDVAMNTVICNNDVELAKCRILKQLCKIGSNPEQVIMDYLPNIAYQDTALSKSVFPESRIIKDFKTEYLVSFKNRMFNSYFMTMICSGAITLNELQKIACKYITESTQEIKTSSCKLNSFPGLKQLRFSGAELRFRDDDEELGYVAIGFEGPTFSKSEDRYAFEVAKEIIGTWDMTHGGANHNAPYLAHSAFNTNMCYSYKSFILDYACNSIWGCYFVCNKLKLDDMVSMLLHEWRRLSTTITGMEVQRAVNKCMFHELMKLNDPVNRFFDIVNCLYLRDCYEPMNDRLTGYKKITTNTIREVASKYIHDQSPVVVALGRIENLTDYNTIQRGTYSFCY
ncbi:mitochondrial-processing peptidase subunit beta-like [Harpegnathos saltator]|uniref:mitochondrial-processing peptidase subunit beta-like n=1 Tax=Harpegnathos saltator TaxID=610380 RepID=UPI000948E6F6|nr:mitochondrial-processing peptidase subunit beta-like [Harpegnathos saltator]